jgi:hypothetical protein
VRDLEAKISAFEFNVQSLQHENERLQLALKLSQTENETLRTTAYQLPTSSPPASARYHSPGACLAQTEANSETKSNVQSLNISSVVGTADGQHADSHETTGGKSLRAAQAWNLIQSHPLVKQGLVDIARVCERLKRAAKCDGHDVVFQESMVLQAVEEAMGGGIDQLL